MKRLFSVTSGLQFKFYSLFLATLTLSCSKTEEAPAPFINNYKAIIVNEGQFGKGSTSLTAINEEGTTLNDVFRKVNDRPLGDIAQSITRIGDKLYVPVNNSKKIEVINPENFESIETIDFNDDYSPLFVHEIKKDLLAVSSYGTYIKLIDLTDGKNTTTNVPTGTNTFQMINSNNKLFIAGTAIHVFDINNVTSSNKRIIKSRSGDTLSSPSLSKLVEDKNGRLWGITSNESDEVYISCINPQTEKTDHEIMVSQLQVSTWGSFIDINKEKDKLYFNQDSKIYSIDINDPKAPTEPLYSLPKAENSSIYMMTISPENTLYISEVIFGNIAKGKVIEYNLSTGKQLKSYQAGIYPSFIYFK